MTSHEPSLLHVSEQAVTEVRPRAAILHVTLTASKLFSGRAALTKSEELRALVEALAEHGLPESALSLAGASIDVSTGLFTRSSSVSYRARIRIDDLDRLGAAFDAISRSKQANLSHVTWDYAGAGAGEVLADCAARAMAKAKRLAAALGVELGAVHEVREEELADPPPPPIFYGSGMVMARKARAEGAISHELEGLDLAPTEQVTARVSVAYRLSPGSRAVL